MTKKIRSKTKKVFVGKVQIGGQENVVIQSMTTTKTSDISQTIKQIEELVKEGCKLVRVAIFDIEDAKALRFITKKSRCPIVADIHFDYKLALTAIKNGAKKIRINPNNIGSINQLKEIVELAKQKKVAIRIGINTGSLPKEIQDSKSVNKIIKFTKKYVLLFEKWGFNQIVLSLKSPDPIFTEQLNLYAAKKFKYPLHIGVTEAGNIIDSSIKSSIGLSSLLKSGIGDTIRISISGSPLQEPKICKKILNACGIEQNIANIISCPTCGRLQYDIGNLLKKVEDYTEKFPKNITIAIMGCSVNGIGESQGADIGIFAGKTHGIIYKNGKVFKTVLNNKLFAEFKKIY